MKSINVILILVFCLLTAACGDGLKSYHSASKQLSSEFPDVGGVDVDDPGTAPEIEEPELPPAVEEVPGAARWEGKATGSRDWTLYLHSQLEKEGPDLLETIPADINNFCPNYRNLSLSQTKDFWVYLISSIAQFESNFRPNTSYTEDFNDSNGNKVISRGLLQLSIESARGYDCVLANANDLHDPYKNLVCGVKILNRWVGRDGVIRGQSGSNWRGGARYWSVLRKVERYESIRGWTKALPYCKL